EGGHEGEMEADEQAPEAGLAEALVKGEAERLRKPVIVARQHAEKDAADDDVMEVGDQEHAVVEHEVNRRDGQQHARHAADDERDNEPGQEQHGRSKYDPPTKHCEEAVEDLDAGWYCDDR